MANRDRRSAAPAASPADPTDQILRAILALGRRMRSERPAPSASLSAISLLGCLRRAGPMPATQLAAEEHLRPQSLTRLVAALDDAGLIARERNPADRRELQIALTSRGRRVLDADLRARRTWLTRAMTALAPSDRAALLAAAPAMLKLAGTE